MFSSIPSSRSRRRGAQGNVALYEFEREDDFRSRNRASTDVERLITRLGLDMRGPYSRLKIELEELVVHCHLAIVWYQKHLRRESWWRRLYFGASLVLLFAIPIMLQVPLTQIVSNQLEKPALVQPVSSGAGAQAVVAAPLQPQPLPQAAGLLTGILAFWRGISGWLDKRQVAALYAKAASDLKTLLYQFEQKWDDINKTPERLPEFEADLEATIAAARRVLEEERLKHYETASYPTIDIASILKTSATEASGLVKELSPLAGAASGVIVQSYRQQIEARIKKYQASLAEENKVYAEAFAANDTSAVKVSMARLDLIADNLKDAELNLAALRSGA